MSAGSGGQPPDGTVAGPVRRRSLIHSGIFHGLSSGSSLLLFLLLVMAGRFLGAEDFGRFSFALAFVFLFDVLLDPGFYHYLIREMARAPGRAQYLLAHALTWKLVAAPVVLLLTAGGAGLLHDSPTTLAAVCLMAVAHILRSLKEGLRTPLLASERFGLDAVSVLFERLMLLLVGSAVLWRGHGLLALCATFVGVRLLDLLLIGSLVRRHVCPVRLGSDLGTLRRLVASAAPIGAFYVTLNVYHYVDTVMLSAMKSSAEVGWYSAAYKVYEGFFLFPAVIGTVLMPRLAIGYQRDLPQFRELLARGMRWSLVAGISLSAGVIVLARPLMALSFGGEFSPSATALTLLMIGLPAVFVLTFLQSALIAMDRQRLLLLLAVGGLATNASLNAVLIPRYSYMGAAGVTVGVEILLLILLLPAVARSLDVPTWWQAAGRPLLVLVPAATLAAWALATAGPMAQAAAVALVLLLLGPVAGVPDARERKALRVLASRHRRSRESA